MYDQTSWGIQGLRGCHDLGIRVGENWPVEAPCRQTCEIRITMAGYRRSGVLGELTCVVTVSPLGVRSQNWVCGLLRQPRDESSCLAGEGGVEGGCRGWGLLEKGQHGATTSAVRGCRQSGGARYQGFGFDEEGDEMDFGKGRGMVGLIIGQVLSQKMKMAVTCHF